MKKVMKLVLGMMILGAVLVSCKTNADSHDHTFSEEWTSDGTGHWHECTGCTEIKDKTAHTWNDGEVTKKPTVAEAGTKTFTCTVCGKTRNEDVKAVLTGITVTSKPSKILYKKNESFDSTGLTVTASYTYGQSKILSVSDYIISGFDSSKEAKVNTVTISYVDAGVTKTADFTVYIQKEMTVTDFLTALGTEVETITSNVGVPGISFSSGGKSANIFGVKLTGDFDYNNYFPSSLITADLRGLDTSSVTSMAYMFYGCSGLTSITFGENFNTSSVKYMSSMFENCEKLENLNLSGFNTSNVEMMENMFINCKSLETLDLRSFNTSKVRNISSMFQGCEKLTSLDLSSFDTTSVNCVTGMFSFCGKSVSLTVKIDSSIWDLGIKLNTFNGGSNLTFQDVKVPTNP